MADYGTRSSVFLCNYNRACVPLPILDDDSPEKIESFYLTLSEPLTLNPRNGVVTIQEDDGILNTYYCYTENFILVVILPKLKLVSFPIFHFTLHAWTSFSCCISD